MRIKSLRHKLSPFKGVLTKKRLRQYPRTMDLEFVGFDTQGLVFQITDADNPPVAYQYTAAGRWERVEE